MVVVAVRVCVSSQVEPVPSPPFTVVRRLEQLINQTLVSVGSAVRYEGINLLERRSQAQQIEAETADQCHAIGFGRRSETLLFETRQEEGADLVTDRSLVLHVRGGRVRGRNKRPVLPLAQSIVR